MQSRLYTKQQNLRISKLTFKTFCPKNNYYYIYFIEKIKPTPKRLSQTCYKLYGIGYASDIQRFCYYPETRNIFTFFGFSTKNRMEMAMKDPSLNSAIINKDIKIYNKSNEIISLKEAESNDTGTILEDEYKYMLVVSLFIEKFKPEKNLYYCFFEEENKPKGCISSSRFQNESYAGMKINDIQRFYLLPNKKNIYTFLGFLAGDELINAITNPDIEIHAKNKEIFVFYENSIINITKDIFNSIQNNQKNYDQDNYYHEYQMFTPINGVFYLYFTERKENKNSKNKLIKELTNLHDTQRFCYYPNNNNIFSFFGFLTVEDLMKNIDFLVLNLYTINEIHVYYSNMKKDSVGMKSLLFNHIKSYAKNYMRIQFENNNNAGFYDFNPKENLIYVYFKDLTNKTSRLLIIADDVQLFRYYPGTKDLYSFYGFSSHKKVEQAVNENLSAFKEAENHIYIYYNPPEKLNSFDSEQHEEFKAKEDLIYFYYKENINENLSEITNCQDIQRFCYYPGTKNVFSFFGFKNKNDLINSIKALKKKLDELIKIKLYHPKETTTMLIITQTSNEKMKFNTLNKETNAFEEDLIQNENNNNNNDTIEINVAPHVVNITKTFEPINKLLYCYFKENKQPTEKDIHKHCKKLYGINSASDIQRFCFYPEQTEVFTFLGFSNKSKLEQAMNQQSLLSSIVDRKIEIYAQNESEEEIKEEEIPKKKESKNCLVLSLFIEEFQPEKDLYYCFFEEKNKPKGFISSTRFRNEKYDDISLNDVQRFYLLPNERNIYTFLGFQTEEEQMDAKTNPKFLELAKNEEIFIYSENSSKSTKMERDKEKPTLKNDSGDVFYNFIPKNNVLYIFFIEKRGPNFKRLKARNRPIRQITNAYDVQRYSYYPKTMNLFSFFGFLSRKSLKRNIENINLLNATLDGKIYFYGRNIKHITGVNKIDLYNMLKTNNISITHFKNTQVSNENDSMTEEMIYNEFSPRENIIYIYFKELENTNSFKMNSFENISSFLKNSNDIQRLCYYPGTKDIYSFFGFLTEKQIENLINDHSFLSKIASNQIYLYYKAPIKRAFKVKNENDFQEFKVKKDLIYFYFEEEMSQFSLNNNDPIKGITNCQDIQRYCYYPGTKNVYSFFGFTNKNYLINSIKKSTMKLNEIFGIKLYYPSKNEKEIQTMIISTQISNEKMKFNPENPIIDYENIKQETPKKIDYIMQNDYIIDPLVLPKFNEYESNDIQFKTFVPQSNLLYCFFAEKSAPNKMVLEKVKKIYQINSASDIQRFCYYPGTNNIYTFIGFANETLLKTVKKKSSLKSAAIDQSIFNYPYDSKEEAKRKEKKTKKSTKEKHYEFDPSILDQYNWYEIPEKYFENLNNDSFQRKSISVDSFQSSSSNDELSPNKTFDSDSFPIQETSYFDKFFKTIDLGPEIDMNESFFTENDELYYIYFREKYYSCKNVHEQDAKLFGIDNIQDLQRGYRFDKDDSDYYTFFGFNHSIDCLYAIKSLLKNKEVVESSIKKLEEEDSISSSDDESENSKSQNLIINNNDSNVDSEINTQFRYRPNANLNQNESQSLTKSVHMQKTELDSVPIKPNDNLTNYQNKDNEKTPEVNTQFRYIHNSNVNSNERFLHAKLETIQKSELNSTFTKSFENSINKENDEMSEIKTQFRYRPACKTNNENAKIVSTENNKNESKVDMCQFPKFNKYVKNDLKFNEFVPKDNLFYLFFAELNEPNYRMVNYKFNSLFGIKFASDIQRFCYYPKTKNIYTFIGFSSQTQRDQAFSMAPIRAGAIEQAIYSYPYESINKCSSSPITDNKTNNYNDTNTTYNNNDASNDNYNSQKEKLVNMIGNDVSKDNYNTINCQKEVHIKMAGNDASNDYNNNNHHNANDDNLIIDNEQAYRNKIMYKNVNNTIDLQKETYFDPEIDLFYIYCKEKNCHVFNHKEKSCSLFNVQNIQDLQRGYRLNDDDSNYYTFFGFSTSIDANVAMSILCNEKQVDISSIHQLDDEESTTSDEDGSFDNYEIGEEEDYADFECNPSQKAPDEKIHF